MRARLAQTEEAAATALQRTKILAQEAQRQKEELSNAKEKIETETELEGERNERSGQDRGC